MSLRDELLTLEKEELVDILVGRAEWDDTLRQQLRLRVAAGTPGAPPSPAALRAGIEAAIVPSDYVDWHGASDYDQRLHAAVNTVEGVLRAGRASEALELAELALALLERAFEQVDDSDGIFRPALERLEAVHFAACLEAHPEPFALARRLFEHELTSALDGFRGAVQRYATALGSDGLDEYRRLARSAWADLHPLGPGDEDREHWSRRRRLADVMLALADLDGDLEARLEVMAHDLSSPYRFLRIAELCKERGDADRALSWAEQGLAAFPAEAEERLVEFLARAYLDAGRPDHAIAVSWRRYAEDPRPDSFRNLAAIAQAAGTWSEWRRRALDHARGEMEREQRRTSGERGGLQRADRSLLVQLLLADGDVEAAWSEAVEGGCANFLWMELARKREDNHPDDAIPIFLRELETRLRIAEKRSYVAAVALLGRIRTAMIRAGREEDFGPLLVEVRAAHKRRRVLLKLIDEAAWGA